MSNIRDYVGGGFIAETAIIVSINLFDGSATCNIRLHRKPKKEPVAMEPSIEEDLEQVHPDEDVNYTFNTRFSLENALDRVGQIRNLSAGRRAIYGVQQFHRRR